MGVCCVCIKENCITTNRDEGGRSKERREECIHAEEEEGCA
jgi:hypothetical protein